MVTTPSLPSRNRGERHTLPLVVKPETRAIVQQALTSNSLYPQALQPGDSVAIISPASPSSKADLDKGIDYLHTLGLTPVLMPYAAGQWHYMAETDDHRLQDLHQAFADPKIKGILCARGGYGCMRIVSRVNWDLIRQNPKVFIGFSDLTSFLLPMFERTGLVGFHGPMLTSNLIEGDTYTQDELWKLVMKKVDYPYIVPNTLSFQSIKEGSAEGPLIGGNLSLLAGLCGTPFQPKTDGAILFIEDWHEKYYSVDRQWQQMKMAGLFNNISGLLLGDFADMDEERSDYPLAELFKELTSDLSVPIGFGYSVGHGAQTATFPIGVPAHFSSTDGRLEILCSPVQ